MHGQKLVLHTYLFHLFQTLNCQFTSTAVLVRCTVVLKCVSSAQHGDE